MDAIDSEETIHLVNALTDIRSQNHFELHVTEFEKRRYALKMIGPILDRTRRESVGGGPIDNYDYCLGDLGRRKNERNKELKKIKDNNPQDMVCRRELTYNENVDNLDK